MRVLAVAVDRVLVCCAPDHLASCSPSLPRSLPSPPPSLQSILFYQLPEHPQFYAELLNLLEEGESGETPTGEGVGQGGRQWAWHGVRGSCDWGHMRGEPPRLLPTHPACLLGCAASSPPHAPSLPPHAPRLMLSLCTPAPHLPQSRLCLARWMRCGWSGWWAAPVPPRCSNPRRPAPSSSAELAPLAAEHRKGTQVCGCDRPADYIHVCKNGQQLAQQQAGCSAAGFSACTAARSAAAYQGSEIDGVQPSSSKMGWLDTMASGGRPGQRASARAARQLNRSAGASSPSARLLSLGC